MFSSVILVLFGWVLFKIYNALVIKPNRIRKILKQQGIHGPEPKILLGNALDMKKSLDEADHLAELKRQKGNPPTIHNSTSVYPFLEEWKKQYGPVFLFSIGFKMQMMCISNPELMKEIATITSMGLGAPEQVADEFAPLFGRGILTSNGPSWARQRKIMAPELYMEKIKGMMRIITESGVELINLWKHEIENCGKESIDISVDKYIERFAGDIISKACFGSSYAQGREIFLKLGDLQEIIHIRFQYLGIPGLSLLPTKTNRKVLALEKEISDSILKVVKERQQSGYEKDLLQILLESAKGNNFSSDSINQFVIDNCRNIYLAGFQTTATAATWCLMLLASNPEWQNRVRNEVQEISKGQLPDIDMLRKMKQLHMVIQETMRLYPTAPLVGKEVFEDMKIGNIKVPKGVSIGIMMPFLHTDKTLWGGDALEFKPQRFENGIASACKIPSCYIPFGFGQRVCIGQHLAMVELKLLIALIVTNFSFTLSNNYVHSPCMKMMIHPRYGVNIVLKKLD